MKTRNLTGIISQLTIFGQIFFIDNNEYNCSVNKDVVTVSGKFGVVGSIDIEQLMIQITVGEYIKHSKS